MKIIYLLLLLFIPFFVFGQKLPCNGQQKSSCCATTKAVVGSDTLLKCINYYKLTGNKPLSGCGKWRVIDSDGDYTLVNPTQHNSNFVMHDTGSYTLVYRIKCCFNKNYWTEDTININYRCLPEDTASAGGIVFTDNDVDGIQDIGEIGIANAKVKIKKVYSNFADSIITGSDGRYLFTGLAPGVYYFIFETPVGDYFSSPSNIGNDAFDSDAGVGGMTGNYILVAGQVDSTVDAGFNCNFIIPFTPLNICGFIGEDLTSYEPVGYTGGVWLLNGVPVVDPTYVEEPGSYTYSKTSLLGCTASGTLVINSIAPDYTPEILLDPSNITGVSTVNIVVTVKELLNNSSCGPVIVTMPVISNRYTFNWNPTLTNITSGSNSYSISNADWRYDGIVTGFHVWTYIGAATFPAGGVSKFGIIGTYDNQGTFGQTSFAVSIVMGSGGEINLLNNNVGAILIYNN
jgi:hypothetical protein